MTPFASVDDLELRYRVLDESEKRRAFTLLDDASSFLEAEFVYCGKEIDPDDELLAVNLKVVCCAMVKRILANGTDADIRQSSITAGSFTEQRTYSNPTGDLYLRDQERRLLGIPKRKMRMGFIMPGSRPYEG